jgi:hypothetical protein
VATTATKTRSARRVAYGVWWKVCGLGALICALAVALCLALRVRRRLPGVSVWEEARLRIIVPSGMRRFGAYLENHAAFDEYCRQRQRATVRLRRH